MSPLSLTSSPTFLNEEHAIDYPPCSSRRRVGEPNVSLSSSSSSSSLFLSKIPETLIGGVFSYLFINQRARSMRLCSKIYRVLSAPITFSPHCVLDECENKFDEDLAKKFISHKNFKFIQTIDLKNTSIKTLKRIFTAEMPKLTHLTLPLKVEKMSNLLNSFTKLISLNLGGNNKQILSEIHLPQLKKLNLEGDFDIFKKEIHIFATKHPELEWLSLESKGQKRCITVPEEDEDDEGEEGHADLSELVFPKLTYLNLTGCGFITDENLIALAANSPELNYLYLSYCQFVETNELDESEFIFPSLKILNVDFDEDCFYNDPYSDNTPFPLARFNCQSLEALEWGYSQNLSGLISFVKKSSLLRSLDLEFCASEVGLLSEPTYLKNLNKLKFSSYSFYNEALAIIGQICPNLEELDFSCQGEVHDDTKLVITPAVVNALNFPNLTDLHLPECHFEEQALDEICRKFPKLKRLTLEASEPAFEYEGDEYEQEKQFSHLCVDSLSRLVLPELEVLNFNKEIPLKMYGIFKNCPKLKWINKI